MALALAETLLPLIRGFADFGRMAGAARRIDLGDVAPCNVGAERGAVTAPSVLSIARTGVQLNLEQGRAVALTGPSGSGKTSLLMQIAGLADGDGIAILGLPPMRWDEAALRETVTMVPQRSALIAGTIRDNLSLGADADDDAMWRALEAVTLAGAIRDRGGLDARLGEGGAGLSGGQARRLTLARALLKAPILLLLDEPTEGLDAETADAVLTGIRGFLPDAAILAVLHRGADHAIFDADQCLTM